MPLTETKNTIGIDKCLQLYLMQMRKVKKYTSNFKQNSTAISRVKQIQERFEIYQGKFRLFCI